MPKLNLFDEVLIALFSSGSPMTRRELATVLFIAERLLRRKMVGVYDIYPDGVESDEVNLVTDILIDDGLLDVRRGYVFLTDDGKYEAEELLSQPENREARLFYWTVSEILRLSPRTRIDLAGLLWMREQGMDVSGLKRAQKVLKSLEERVSILSLAKPPVELRIT